MAQLKDLLVNGAARILGKVTAEGFVGNLEGTVNGLDIPEDAEFTDTWVANSSTEDGYVAKSDGQANKVWGTDESGNVGWQDSSGGGGGGDYLPLSGGTLTGELNLANNTWNKFGDDVYIGDKNYMNALCVKGSSGAGRILLFNSNDAYYAEVLDSTKIVDNLTTSSTGKVLDAHQGWALNSKLNDKLGTTSDLKTNTVTYTAGDTDDNATKWTDVNKLANGETLAVLLNKISTMVANVRYLWSLNWYDQHQTASKTHTYTLPSYGHYLVGVGANQNGVAYGTDQLYLFVFGQNNKYSYTNIANPLSTNVEITDITYDSATKAFSFNAAGSLDTTKRTFVRKISNI